jgi:hypothetical protein
VYRGNDSPALSIRGGNSLAVSVHLGTSLRYVNQVPKCPKVVHLGLDHVCIRVLCSSSVEFIVVAQVHYATKQMKVLMKVKSEL